MKKPLVIDGFCGLGGWAEGFLAAGWQVIGFDIERHQYGDKKYPGELFLQDALTVHGSQFKDADCLVFSPPCQKYSWLSMPWSRSKSDAANLEAAKQLRKEWEENGPDNRLFDACFRIQKEASDAAGRYIPMVIENVRGAQEWVGQAKAKYGTSFYLWGDVEQVGRRVVAGKPKFGNGLSGMAFKVPSITGWRTDIGNGARFTSRDCGVEGSKQGGDWFNSTSGGISRTTGSKSPARKQFSAEIAMILFPLAKYIAESFKP